MPTNDFELTVPDLYIQGTTNVVCLILGDLSQSARTLGEVVKRKTFVKADTDNCTDWEIYVDKQGWKGLISGVSSTNVLESPQGSRI